MNENLILSTIDRDELAREIAEKVFSKIEENRTDAPSPDLEPLDDFITKAEVINKIASGSTLWKMEKEGRITLYSFRGKRFYKRSELIEAFEIVKQ